MTSELLFFNGVNASRGEYGRAPMSVDALARLVRGNAPEAARPERLDPDAEQRRLLQQRVQLLATGSFEVKEGVRQDDLAQTGWGVIFPAAFDYSAVREALAPLLLLRQSQAGDLFRECIGPAGYRSGESRGDFLKRQGAATSGVVDPKRFPYYLLIVGSPEEISFRFQYQLDVQYAVGRLHFATLDEYAQYARSVVATENGEVRLARRAVFFAAQNPDDPATRRAASELVSPLLASLRAERRAEQWQLDAVTGEQATKARLGRLLGGDETPALLFTASHGAEFDQVDPRQLRHQGALICQDWPGPQAWRHRALPPDFYFAGEDVADDARLLGTVAFHFACFGAGTPRLDDFPQERGALGAIAPHAFVSPLAQRLLGHPRGGALAVIGHVERAWTYSFSDSHGARHSETFDSALRRIMLAGAPVGWALEFFNNRYAELATGLTEDLENIRWGQNAPDDWTLTTRWTEHNDARSYVILGDPAVRLPLARGDAPAERASLPAVASVATQAPAPAPATAMPAPASPAPAPASPAPAPAPWAPQNSGAPAAASVHTPAGFVPAGAPPPGYIPGPIVIYPGYVPAQSPAAPGDPASSFGLGDMFRGGGETVNDTVRQLTDSLKRFAEKLGETLQATIEDAAHLEVETYVADDLASVAYRKGDFSGAELRAVTRMSLDGDTQAIVPRREGGGVDAELWAVHTAMVAQAQANRAEMIRAIAQAAAGVVAALQGK